MDTPGSTTPTKPKKVRKYEYETITVKEGSRPTPSSKYDFVKVKVWLEDHYYVLSRFLVSRVLNVTKVDQIDAVKIALELKKRLVDQGMMSVSQLDMENQLFQILKSYGYGNEYIQRYRMTTKFHHQRVPLIIIITGTRCVGKSWLATQLAERLNLSTVLQTSLVYDLMYTIMRDLPSSVSSPYPAYDPVPLIYRAKDKNALIEEYQRECKMIREGVETDIEKCLEEGKAIIIEGPNLDPALFIELLQQRSIPASTQLPTVLSPAITSLPFHPPPTATSVGLSSPLSSMTISPSTKDSTNIKIPKDPATSNNNNINNNLQNNNHTTKTTSPTRESTTEQVSASESEKATTEKTEKTEKAGKAEKAEKTDNPEKMEKKEKKEKKDKKDKDKDKDSDKEKKKKEGITKGIIVPFILNVNATEHKLMVENWLSCSPRDQEFAKHLGSDPETQANALVARLQYVQDYLLHRVPAFHRVDVNAQSLSDTLSVLHSTVLDRIQQVYTDEGFGV